MDGRRVEVGWLITCTEDFVMNGLVTIVLGIVIVTNLAPSQSQAQYKTQYESVFPEQYTEQYEVTSIIYIADRTPLTDEEEELLALQDSNAETLGSQPTSHPRGHHSVLSTGIMLGLPTQAQLFLAVHPKHLPSFRVMAGPMFFTPNPQNFFQDSWRHLNKGGPQGYSVDVNAEMSVPGLRFIKLAGGYQWNRMTSYGRDELAGVLNEQLAEIDENLPPLTGRDVNFSVDGFYYQVGLKIWAFRVEGGLAKYRMRSLAEMIHRNIGPYWDSWSAENTDLPSATRNSVGTAIEENREGAVKALQSLHDDVFPYGFPFLRVGFQFFLNR